MFRSIKRKTILITAATAAALAATAGTAVAATGSSAPPQATRGCVEAPGRTLNTVYQNAGSFPGCGSKGFAVSLSGTGATGPAGPAGPKGGTGATGPAGPSGLNGAFYSVENYPNGGDGWATAACDPNDAANSQKYAAIAGGVEEDDAPGNNGPQGSSVIASFPGRMDWTTNSPEAGRLDGWVIGLSGGDNNPLKVWALCVPVTDGGTSGIPVVTNTDS